MSFERFSTSDVYMFEHVGGFIECCGCWFSGDWFKGDVTFPQLKTPREALAHLDKHEAAGHDIGAARIRIEKEYPNLDIEIEPYETDPKEIQKLLERIWSLPERFRDKSNGE